MNANASTNILFHAQDILVTPAMARFGAVTYQMSGISSVAVYHRPKLNPIAVTLALAAVALTAFAYLGREQYADYSLWSAIAAPVALILGAIWQRVRPVMEYRLVMRTAGNETETVTTFDRAQVFELRQAIEDAIPHAADSTSSISTPSARRASMSTPIRVSTSRAIGSSPMWTSRRASLADRRQSPPASRSKPPRSSRPTPSLATIAGQGRGKRPRETLSFAYREDTT